MRPVGVRRALPVVVAWHAFWFALLAPAGLVAARSFSPRTVRLLGLTLVNAAFLLLVAYGAWDMATWWPHARDWGRPYVVQRFLFAIVTLYDAPLLEALAVGACVWYVGLRRMNGVPPKVNGNAPAAAAASESNAEVERLG